MRSLLSITLAIVCVLVAAAQADVAVVTLDAGTVPGGLNCGDEWVEADVTLSFVPQTPDDCGGGGACFFGVGGLDPDGVDLYPARLSGNFVLLNGVVTGVEADVIDYCGNNCTRLFLTKAGVNIDQDGNTTVGSPETLAVSAGGEPVDRLAVSSCEGALLEIRVYYDPPLPTEPTTWGAVKALFEE